MSGFTVRVRFLETREVQDGSGTVFEEGREYDLPPDSARHWLRREVAEEVDPAGPQVTAPEGPPPPPPPADEEVVVPAEEADSPAPAPKRRLRLRPDPAKTKDT